MTDLIQAAKEQASRLIQAAYEDAAGRGLLPAGRDIPGGVEMPQDDSRGDFASSFALAGAGALGVPPKQTARIILEHLRLDGTLFEGAGPAGPGYLNLFCAPRWYTEVLDAAEQSLPAPVPGNRPLPVPPAPLTEVRRQAWEDALAGLGAELPGAPADVGPVGLLREGRPAPNADWTPAGEDALRFFLTLRPIARPVELDLDLAARQDGGNPLYYVQYTWARIGALLARPDGEGAGADTGPAPPAAEDVRALVKVLARYPEELRTAAGRLDPGRVGRYLTALSEAARRVCQAPGPSSADRRRALNCTRLVLADGLGRLGAGTGKIFSEGVAICGKPW